MRAHRGLAFFRGESSLATWLHRIGFNLARNRYWYFFRRKQHLTVSLDSSPLSGETNATFSELVPRSWIVRDVRSQPEQPFPSRELWNFGE